MPVNAQFLAASDLVHNALDRLFEIGIGFVPNQVLQASLPLFAMFGSHPSSFTQNLQAHEGAVLNIRAARA